MHNAMDSGLMAKQSPKFALVFFIMLAQYLELTNDTTIIQVGHDLSTLGNT